MYISGILSTEFIY